MDAESSDQIVSGVNEFFVALAGHPNVQSTVVLGLGCETLQGNEVTESITKDYPETEYVVIQESAGMAGALDSSIATAKSLQGDAERVPLNALVIGIEGFPNPELLQQITEDIQGAGHSVVVANRYKESSRNFGDLVRAKCHLILSFPDPQQPPFGLPIDSCDYDCQCRVATSPRSGARVRLPIECKSKRSLSENPRCS